MFEISVRFLLTNKCSVIYNYAIDKTDVREYTFTIEAYTFYYFSFVYEREVNIMSSCKCVTFDYGEKFNFSSNNNKKKTYDIDINNNKANNLSNKRVDSRKKSTKKPLVNIFVIICIVAVVLMLVLFNSVFSIKADASDISDITVNNAAEENVNVPVITKSNNNNDEKIYSSIVISEGDTLYNIATKYHGTYESINEYMNNIIEINNLSGDKIRSGMKLIYYHY